MSAALTDILLAQRPSCGDQPLSRFMTLSHGSRVYAVALKNRQVGSDGQALCLARHPRGQRHPPPRAGEEPQAMNESRTRFVKHERTNCQTWKSDCLKNGNSLSESTSRTWRNR